jgi:hypothetical protein
MTLSIAQIITLAFDRIWTFISATITMKLVWYVDVIWKTGKGWNVRRNTCDSATQSTTNPTGTGVRQNVHLCSEQAAAHPLIQSTIWELNTDVLMTFILRLYCINSSQRVFLITTPHHWGTALQTGRSRVRFSMVLLEFFIDITLPAALWPWSRLSN